MDKVIQILKMLPALFTAVKSVEEALPQAGLGAEKLGLLREILEGTYESISDIWPAVANAVSKIVSLFNKVGVFKK